eukprot:9362402-Pyramimonas_sp.AAC.1
MAPWRPSSQRSEGAGGRPWEGACSSSARAPSAPRSGEPPRRERDRCWWRPAAAAAPPAAGRAPATATAAATAALRPSCCCIRVMAAWRFVTLSGDSSAAA